MATLGAVQRTPCLLLAQLHEAIPLFGRFECAKRRDAVGVFETVRGSLTVRGGLSIDEPVDRRAALAQLLKLGGPHSRVTVPPREETTSPATGEDLSAVRDIIEPDASTEKQRVVSHGDSRRCSCAEHPESPLVESWHVPAHLHDAGGPVKRMKTSSTRAFLREKRSTWNCVSTGRWW